MNNTLKTVLFLTLICVFGADEDGVKRESVTEGDSVTLDTLLREKFNRIVWRFGDSSSFIAETNVNETSYTEAERFRDRLELNHQTGSLIIKNMRITDSGVYKLEINHNTETVHKRFSVTVSGLTSGAKAGIVVVLLVFSAAAVFLLSTQNL